MKCRRCGSVMVYERFYGADEHFLGSSMHLMWKDHASGDSAGSSGKG
jgi:hypothetical protein